MRKIIALVGPTGIGKTKMSLMLAKYFNAIIINADSMQVYKGLDIGTGKIKKEEMDGIKHFLLDIKEVDEEYNAFNYQQDLRELLNKYNDKNIIIVGGTGLYFKAGLYDYNFQDETGKDKLLYDVSFIGLTLDRKVLYERINRRVDEMVKEGLIEEVKSFYDKQIKTKPLIKGIGYKELYLHFAGEISLEEAIELIKYDSRKYAKRQWTWFNNQMPINWFDVSDFDKAYKEIITYLNS